MPRQDAPAGLSRLVQIRILFAVNAGWWVLALPVVLLLSLDTGTGAFAQAVALAAAAAVGTAVVLLVPSVSERARLRVDSEESLVRSYFTRHILRIAFVDLPVIVGVVGWVTTGNTVAYLVGVPFTLLAAARAAPTPHRIAIDQQEITDKGSALSLRAVLERPARPTP
ncbi:MAG TPA: hypothetical protein VMQ81_10035 [Acidimicrobiia bacterium]|nr:hypothetical protein [Acidimicrobiia bacterium]